MKSIWSGSISFGLVNIPVKAFPASEEHILEFDMLHKKDLSPIRYARICKAEEIEVPFEEIVKGYELEKGEYIVIEKKDFEQANVRKTKTIDIQHFALIDDIDSIYFSKPYYLAPDKKGEKAYSLLREALKKSKKVAIASFVFRNKEHIGVVRAYGDVLLLIQLRYEKEIRSSKELNIPKEKVAEKEVTIALKLVDQLTEKFQPKKYKDTYTEELEATIEAKAKGKRKVAKKEKVVRSTSAHDLMHLLKQSLGKSLEEKEPKKRAKMTPMIPKSKRVKRR